jgi:hypothetical protein
VYKSTTEVMKMPNCAAAPKKIMRVLRCGAKSHNARWR